MRGNLSSYRQVHYIVQEVSAVDQQNNSPLTPIRVYQQVALPSAPLTVSGDVLAKVSVFLSDRPGSLAGFAATIAHAGGNISFFHYNRSIDSSRVAAEAHFRDQRGPDALLTSLNELHYRFSRTRDARDEILVTVVESVLEIKVRLPNEPGTLAAFAGLLAAHSANVLYMLYNEELDPESADIALATASPREISALLQTINEKGYYYRVVYRGGHEQAVSHIIGLKMVEKFFLRLKQILPASDVAEIKSLVESSTELYQDLVLFATEAGNNLEAGDVYETVLTFASRSRSRTGDLFTAAEMQQLSFPGPVTLYGFRLPTSENIYLFRHGEELTMIDAGHGIYYNDVKKLLRSRGMDPSQVKRIFITHPDTDHAGMAGYFEREFGTQVFMHAGSADVIANTNRAVGVMHQGLLNLNKYYTRLSIRFTECLFPARPHYFPRNRLSALGSFTHIDTFKIGPLVFDVLESLGGHTPGLVFFLNREFGLLFTSDFLLNVSSLRPEDKEHLGIYRYLLTSPNRDSRVYKEETKDLKRMMLTLQKELNAGGRTAYIFPGHGDYYAVAALAE
jgi:glyoxylase-like metal-dependent hydrolase (beta-lactamase superfamily II)